MPRGKGTLTDTTNPVQIGHEINGNEEVLYTSQISRTGASPTDTV